MERGPAMAKASADGFKLLDEIAERLGEDPDGDLDEAVDMTLLNCADLASVFDALLSWDPNHHQLIEAWDVIKGVIPQYLAER